MKLRVSAVQCLTGKKAFESAEKLVFSSDSDLYLLPEYFSYSDDVFTGSIAETTIDWLKKISRERGAIVAGNAVRSDGGKYYNTLYVFHDGDLVAVQDKIHPTESEKKRGICCGEKLKVFELDGIRYSALICADILYPELCRIPGLKGVDVVLNPVVSFKKSQLPAQEFRHCLYFTRSFDNAYAIVKAGGVGITFTGERCVGRSLISTPEGIISRYENENSEELIEAEIDIGRIREYRKVNYSLRDRNISAMRELLDGGIEC
ncbi:nitrilase-related carbon-nitrogen hydrolase [Geoglobus acetivorans]|uniref:Carbon-nitrogen hydrolase family protein n=1 Tax=Geoglobus acetivorans TaxID=565033 RepID=A0ABZ3H258_GEOAI|nr:carbon-nitrogen hydrolase family protein [Geoglobus acetivorans]